MNENVQQTPLTFGEMAGLMLIVAGIAFITCMYFFSDNRVTYTLKYPLAASVDGFTRLHPEREITNIVPLRTYVNCYDRITNEPVVCAWMAQTKLRETRFDTWLKHLKGRKSTH
jgi:hypothetical protein